MDSEQTNVSDSIPLAAPVDPNAPATFTCVFQAAFEFTDSAELREKLRQLFGTLKTAGLEMDAVTEVAGRVNGQVVRIALDGDPAPPCAFCGSPSTELFAGRWYCDGCASEYAIFEQRHNATESLERMLREQRNQGFIV